MSRPMVFTLFVCLALGLTAISCSPGKSKKDGTASTTLNMPIPRADPGYVQQLERMAMLTRAGEMARIVSGSELAWRTSGAHEGPDILLRHADIWLSINPTSFISSTRRTTFDLLNDSSMWPILREAGIKGIYVAPIFGSGSLWANQKPEGLDSGEDIVQFSFAPTVGQETHYRRFMNNLIDNQALIGSDLLPAATGIGPDFFLAARFYREYPGIYCMVEIPREFWKMLPVAEAEWDNRPLTPEQVAALNAQRILPLAMMDEISELSGNGGWAATGEVSGVDGNTRRWVYRYYQDPSFAVLNWEDPSRTANRILSGSAVHQVGMLGQAFIGLRFDALMGLDPAPMEDASISVASNDDPATGLLSPSIIQKRFPLEPALPAAQSISREIRRYGGWSWLRTDCLPLSEQAEFLRAGADFVTDNAFSPAAEHALLTGDASLLRFMVDEVLRLNVDTRRLVHSMPAEEGINYSLPHLEYLSSRPGGEDASRLLVETYAGLDRVMARQSPPPLKDDVLYTTSAGLAAMALDIPLDIEEEDLDNPMAEGNEKLAMVMAREKQTDGLKQKRESIADGHSLLVFFKAMQPGVLMLSGQDLVGAMPLRWDSVVDSVNEWDVRYASRGGYALTRGATSLLISQQGVPRSVELYPPADSQVLDDSSFLRKIGEFLRLRPALGIASGTLIARPQTRGQGSVALLSRMPEEESYLLTVCNFSRQRVTERIPLGDIPGIRNAMERITGLGTDGGNYRMEETTMIIDLGPWEGKAYFMGRWK